MLLLYFVTTLEEQMFPLHPFAIFVGFPTKEMRRTEIRPHRFGGEGVLIGVQTATLNA